MGAGSLLAAGSHGILPLTVLSLVLVLLLPRPVAGEDQRALLELVVNDVSKGEVLVLLRDPDALLTVADLGFAGLKGFGGLREEIGGEIHVSLRSLAPDVTFEVDRRELRLIVRADPRLLGERVRDLRSGPPADLVYGRNTSGFVNYSLSVMGKDRYDLFTESATNVAGVLLYNTLTANQATTIRGLTSATFDERSRMRRWVVGDSFALAGPLAGDAWIAGLNVSREFSLDPYFVRYAPLTMSTPVTVPSTVEVYVNGRLVSQEQVAPGLLDVRNMPLTSGRNDARVVVRDPFGGSRELSTSYYLGSSALAPGLHDYQYSVGFLRTGLGTTSWDYSSPVALARHRVGLTRSVTLGGHLAGGGHRVVGGPTLNLRLPVGELEMAAALSGSERGRGAAGLASFAHSGRPFSGGGSIRLASADHVTLGPRAVLEPVAVDGGVFGSVTLHRALSVTLQHGGTRLHSGLTRERSSVLVRSRVRRNMDLSVTALPARGEAGRSAELHTGLTLLFGRASATVMALTDSDQTRLAFDAQRSLPAGAGYGFQLRTETGPNASFTGAAQAQSRFGRYELRQDSFAGQSQGSLSVMGALVAIGGGLYATRPVRDGFALVRVPGVKGVRAFASHQEIGRTDAGGNLLVPSLEAYYGNRLTIADADVPLEYAIDNVGLTLAVPYRGGAVAVFPVQRVRRISGSLRLVSGGVECTPSAGEVAVALEGRSVVSPIGLDGAFYFEDLPVGRHTATARTGEASCAFTLDVPASSDPVTDLRLVRCVASDRP